MFDIGFWELIIIAVVALFVVGPERFPGMIKKTGQMVGQFRRIAASVKSEIQVEVDKADQLQSLLEEQKEILKRNTTVDLTQPAVKLKQATEKQTPEKQESLVESDSSPVVKSSEKNKSATESESKPS